MHDASVLSINYDRESKLVSVFGKRHDCIAKKMSPFEILFSNASLLSIPHVEEWGPSDSILETVRLSILEFQIQMQSGDLIVINAERFNFE